MLWATLWALVLGFVLSGAVQSFVSRTERQRSLGDHRPVTLARSSSNEDHTGYAVRLLRSSGLVPAGEDGRGVSNSLSPTSRRPCANTASDNSSPSATPTPTAEAVTGPPGTIPDEQTARW